ncbi:MAG TPA: hypothetical protein VMH04_24045 [Candidatus Solibacter sp.]|nr:hypothetical protein [Candidatus Solibacter sp.]
MANATKDILRVVAKHLEMINSHLEQYHNRLELIEATIRKRPELAVAYHEAQQENKGKLFSPGPQTQLRAVQQAVERIPN